MPSTSHFRMRARTLIAFVGTIAVISLLRTDSHAADAEIERIVAAIEDYSRQINTLQGTYDLTMTSHLDESKLGPRGLVRRDMRDVVQFSADVRDGRIAIEKTSWFRYPDVSPDLWELRSKSGFDGTRSYDLSFTSKEAPFKELGPDPDVPFRMAFVGTNPTFGGLHLLDWTGLRVPPMFPSKNLAGLCRTARLSLGTGQTIAGQLMPQLILEDGVYALEVTVDPNYGYIPRAIRVLGISKDLKDPAKRPARTTMEVLEYMEVKDSSSGGRVWFPLRGTGKSLMDYEFLVREMVLNPSLEPSTFQVDVDSLPPGVLVEGDGPNRYYTGDAKELWEFRKKKYSDRSQRIEEILKAKRGASAISSAAAAPLSPVPSSSTNVRVAPSSPHWIFWLIGVCSIGTLACGLYLMSKRR